MKNLYINAKFFLVSLFKEMVVSYHFPDGRSYNIKKYMVSVRDHDGMVKAVNNEIRREAKLNGVQALPESAFLK